MRSVLSACVFKVAPCRRLDESQFIAVGSSPTSRTPIRGRFRRPLTFATQRSALLATPSRRASNRQRPNPYPRFFEHDDASLSQSRLYVRKVRKQQSQLLFRTAARGAAEENYRRLLFFAEGQDSTEVSIGGYDNTPFLLGTIEDYRVVGCLETVVTYVSGVVPCRSQSVRDEGRKGVID